jgi:arabinan endo-1,5-alpha-L-arabinosidase
MKRRSLVYNRSGFSLPKPLRNSTLLVLLPALLMFTACGGGSSSAPPPPPPPAGTYTNPLPIQTSTGAVQQDCPDPSIIHGQNGDTAWYMYCTTDPLSDADKDVNGNYIQHLITMHSSQNLVHWMYLGDVFSARPSWVASTAGLWAPAIKYFNNRYYLYYAAADTSLPGGGGAIGVATSASPTGPWTDSGTAVVMPEDALCCPGSRRWAIDPEVIQVNGQNYIYFGSFFGGVSVRKLSADGLTSDPASEVLVASDDRFEATNIVQHGGFYYLLASNSNCCNGPLSGYAVFAGRATDPLGPFVDSQGVWLLASRTGGTPVIAMNGNRWVGPGHNAVFTDMGGQDWFLYHAIDVNNPYFAGSPGFTKRPVMLDALDWINGWPTVRGGAGPSDSPQPVPAAQLGEHSQYTTPPATQDTLGTLIAASSDDFNGSTLSPQWNWIRQPASSTYRFTGSSFEFDTQAGDLYVDTNNASVLVEATPASDYIVETRVKLTVPATGCCFNYVQAGLVIYRNDDNYVRLAHVSIDDTRQTEFAKELAPVPAGYPRYGNTFVGPPGDWTWLRIAKRSTGSGDTYTASTSADGQTWTRGGTWTHNLGPAANIGLVSLGGSGFTADFDYVHVYTIGP